MNRYPQLRYKCVSLQTVNAGLLPVTTSNDITFIVVEDEPQERIMYEQIMKTKGINYVEGSGEGEDVLANIEKLWAQGKAPHIVVMDIKLSGKLSGIDLAKTLFERFGIFSIYVSAFVDEDSQAKVAETPALGHYAKPLTAQNFLAAIGSVKKTYMLIAAYILEQKKHISELQGALGESMEALIHALEHKHPYTKGHSERVTKIGCVFAKILGFSEAEISLLEMASQLHDIGKIGVPDRVLDKPGQLTAEEFDQIKQHINKGIVILKPLERYPGMERIILIMSQHHEKWDGSGYILGLKGDAIEPLAQIMAVADAIDAMTSSRSYRIGLPLAVCLERLLSDTKTQFNPKIIRMILESYVTEMKRKENCEPDKLAVATTLLEEFDDALTKYPFMKDWITDIRNRGLVKPREHTVVQLVDKSVDLSSFLKQFPSKYSYDHHTGIVDILGEVTLKERDILFPLLTSDVDKTSFDDQIENPLFDQASAMKALALDIAFRHFPSQSI